MKTGLLTAFATTVALSLSACGSSGDDPNTLVELPTLPTDNSNGGQTATPGGSLESGADANPTLLNGRHTIELGDLIYTEQSAINYGLRAQQRLYIAADSFTAVFCIASFSIGDDDIGQNAAYTAFVENTVARGAQTVSIVDIQGPTINVGIEYIYNADVDDTNLTSIAHVHYFNPADVTFNRPALSSIECATPTNQYGQNESQMRAVLNSVTFLRGTN